MVVPRPSAQSGVAIAFVQVIAANSLACLLWHNQRHIDEARCSRIVGCKLEPDRP